MDDQKKEETIMRNCNSSSGRSKRNFVERNRRKRLKDLFSELFSLIPSQNSKVSASDLVVQATTYVKQLQERIETLKESKHLLLLKGNTNFEPLIYVKSSEATLEVNIICGSEKSFLLHQVIKVFAEEGAQVVNTTYCNACDRVFCTIYSEPVIPRIGVDTSRVEERLKKLIS